MNEQLQHNGAEQLLVRYCAEGDEQAFDQLVHHYEHEIYNYLLRYLRNPQLAEEAFQSAFLRVHEKCHQFDPQRRLRPWLYTIATHEAVNALRAEGRQHSRSLDAPQSAADSETGTLLNLLESEVPGPLVQLQQDEWRQWTRRAIDDLPEHLRQVVLLIFFQGLKYREAAEALELPVGTVKSRMHKALLLLNKAWRHDHPRTRTA